MFVVVSFPIVVSCWLIAAHFLRDGNFFLVLACFFAPGLLLFEERWAARTLQIGLFLASFEWIHTLIDLVMMRMMDQQPFIRLALILGTVAAWTFGSALLFQLPVMKKRFELMPPSAPPSPQTAVDPADKEP
ncbi:MAG: hypothetical protein HQM09_22510 [Candidatus Riflebacteria bacterium]|nr:hypothetical protein [Candidatus Riflebacteria bacterium]